jgi:hypothetical protein
MNGGIDRRWIAIAAKSGYLFARRREDAKKGKPGAQRHSNKLWHHRQRQQEKCPSGTRNIFASSRLRAKTFPPAFSTE